MTRSEVLEDAKDVMAATGCSLAEAVEALLVCGGCIDDAIAKIRQAQEASRMRLGAERG